MTQAIAIPISTAHTANAASATNAGASAAGEGFAAALAGLLGVHSTVGTQVHAHTAKAQSAHPEKARNGETDSATNGTPVVPGLVSQTPVQPVTAQTIAADAAAAKAVKAPTSILPPPAAPAGAAAAAAMAADTSDAATATTATATQPQTAQAIAAAATALATVQATEPATQPTPAAGVKAAQKAAAAKHTPTQAAPAQRAEGDAQAQTPGKPSATPNTAAAQEQPANQNAGGNGSQLPGAKPDATAAQLSASATPVVMTVHNAPDAQAATAAATTAAPPAIPLDALAVHIARKFESGESKFEIRLDPIELGKLDISMTVTEDGRVQAVVRAERPETLDMLQRDARLLENQLRQSGLNVDSNSLNFSLGGGNRQAFAEAGQSSFSRAMNPASPDIEQQTMASTIVSVRDGLDIRI